MTIPHDTQGGRLRRPEYTGENRCVPCTIFNLVIAAAIAAVTAVVIGPSIAVIVLVGSLTAIWFRGYLVPGTPELTKRYLPNHVLSLFGKATDVGETRLSVAVPPDFDPEAYLLSAGILVETADESDLAFAPWFADAWQTALDKGGAAAENRADDDLAALATLTGIDVTTLSLDWHGASGVAFADDSTSTTNVTASFETVENFSAAEPSHVPLEAGQPADNDNRSLPPERGVNPANDGPVSQAPAADRLPTGLGESNGSADTDETAPERETNGTVEADGGEIRTDGDKPPTEDSDTGDTGGAAAPDDSATDDETNTGDATGNDRGGSGSDASTDNSGADGDVSDDGDADSAGSADDDKTDSDTTDDATGGSTDTPEAGAST